VDGGGFLELGQPGILRGGQVLEKCVVPPAALGFICFLGRQT